MALCWEEDARFWRGGLVMSRPNAGAARVKTKKAEGERAVSLEGKQAPKVEFSSCRQECRR